MITEYIFRKCNSTNVIFDALLNESNALLERICSPRSKLFPLRVDSVRHGPAGLKHLTWLNSLVLPMFSNGLMVAFRRTRNTAVGFVTKPLVGSRTVWPIHLQTNDKGLSFSSFI